MTDQEQVVDMAAAAAGAVLEVVEATADDGAGRAGALAAAAAGPKAAGPAGPMSAAARAARAKAGALAAAAAGAATRRRLPGAAGLGGRGSNPGRLRSPIAGLQSTIERHPQRDAIDYALVNRTQTVAMLAEAYPGVTQTMLNQRRKALKQRIAQGSRVLEKKKLAGKVERAAMRTLDLLAYPLEEARELGAMAKGMAVEARDAGNRPEALEALDRSRGFLDSYMKTVETYGRLTGDLAPPGQTLVNQDNRSIAIMSLPRHDDPPEVIEAAQQMLMGGGASTAGGAGK